MALASTQKLSRAHRHNIDSAFKKLMAKSHIDYGDDISDEHNRKTDERYTCE